MLIDIKNVKNYEEVFIIHFYDGYIDGCKYSVVALNTDRMGFYATVGAKYYSSYEEAAKDCLKFNENDI